MYEILTDTGWVSIGRGCSTGVELLNLKAGENVKFIEHIYEGKQKDFRLVLKIINIENRNSYFIRSGVVDEFEL